MYAVRSMLCLLAYCTMHDICYTLYAVYSFYSVLRDTWYFMYTSLTDLWSSISLISDTGSLKKTPKGSPFSGGRRVIMTDRQGLKLPEFGKVNK